MQDMKVFGDARDNLAGRSVPGVVMWQVSETKLMFVCLQELRNTLGCNNCLRCGLFTESLPQSAPIEANYINTLRQLNI
jgi:hypothetical protein